ncbi:MAG: ribonuclease HI family protein [Candidatus Latescibacteria bacterium]|jgi:ribonuclease HI|nr:ribonuclease HI family protein [Candidatus Latescibacterota bacterium]
MIVATLHCDGGCEPNPGTMGIGGHITIDNVDVADFSKKAGNGTNNQAEYLALIHGAKLARELKVTHLNVVMDSQLILNQMTGIWRNKDAELTKLMRDAKQIMVEFDKVTYEHVLRANNKQADMLATQGRTGSPSKPAKKTRTTPANNNETQEMLKRIEMKLDILLLKMDANND